jgi:hypothetical protein
VHKCVAIITFSGILYEVKKKKALNIGHVCLISVTWYQQLSSFLDYKEICYRRAFQKAVEQAQFLENSFTDIHTSLKSLNDFVPILFIFFD